MTVATDPMGESLKVTLCRIACIPLIVIGEYADCRAICDVLEMCEDFEQKTPRKERCDHPRPDHEMEDCRGCLGTGNDFVTACQSCCTEAFPSVNSEERKKCDNMCEEEARNRKPPGAK